MEVHLFIFFVLWCTDGYSCCVFCLLGSKCFALLLRCRCGDAVPVMPMISHVRLFGFWKFVWWVGGNAIVNVKRQDVNPKDQKVNPKLSNVNPMWDGVSVMETRGPFIKADLHENEVAAGQSDGFRAFTPSEREKTSTLQSDSKWLEFLKAIKVFGRTKSVDF